MSHPLPHSLSLGQSLDHSDHFPPCSFLLPAKPDPTDNHMCSTRTPSFPTTARPRSRLRVELCRRLIGTCLEAQVLLVLLLAGSALPSPTESLRRTLLTTSLTGFLTTMREFSLLILQTKLITDYKLGGLGSLESSPRLRRLQPPRCTGHMERSSPGLERMQVYRRRGRSLVLQKCPWTGRSLCGICKRGCERFGY